MGFFCIGGEDAVRGFRLAGVPGRAASDAAGAGAALDEALARPDCEVVIMTDFAAALARARVEEVRQERARPLIVLVPET